MKGTDIIGQLLATTVGEAFGIAPDTIRCSTERNGQASLARHVAMWLAHGRLGLSYKDAARALNCSNHNSAMYGVERIDRALEHDDELAATIAAIAGKLRDAFSVISDAHAMHQAASQRLLEAEETKAKAHGLTHAVGAFLRARERLEADLHTRAERASRLHVEASLVTLTHAYEAIAGLSASPPPRRHDRNKEHAHA